MEQEIKVMVALPEHEVYVDTILDTIREAAKKRGTGIAERTHEYVATKMTEAKAVIQKALDYFKVQRIYRGNGMTEDRPAMHMVFTVGY